MGARYTLSTPGSVGESEKHDFEMVESMKSVDPISLTVSRHVEYLTYHNRDSGRQGRPYSHIMYSTTREEA